MISSNLKKRLNTSLFLFLILILIFKYNFLLGFTLIVLGVLGIIEFLSILKKILKKKLFFYLLFIIFIIYIFTFCTLFFYFSNFYQLKILLFIILLGCIFSDIGGFIFGKLIQGPKLTKISPNKTISGSIGSLIFCSMIILSLIFFFNVKLNLTIFIISLIISIACQFGDLFFSLLKRKAKLKDTGYFLPGHGGILDRIDGILAGLPVGLILFILFIK